MVEPKVYIYCFGDIILLLKCVQEERLKKVKLLSTIDPQIIQSNAGKQFSTYKYKKAGEIISISWDYSKAIWTLIYFGCTQFCVQIKGLVNYCQWQIIICKLWLLIEMKIYRDHFFIANVHSTANIGTCMDSSN